MARRKQLWREASELAQRASARHDWYTFSVSPGNQRASSRKLAVNWQRQVPASRVAGEGKMLTHLEFRDVPKSTIQAYQFDMPGGTP